MCSIHAFRRICTATRPCIPSDYYCIPLLRAQHAQSVLPKKTPRKTARHLLVSTKAMTVGMDKSVENSTAACSNHYFFPLCTSAAKNHRNPVINVPR